MPSPFPGMDPWLESSDIWPDLHDRLASDLSAVLNQILPGPYYARLEMRPEVQVVDQEEGVPYKRLRIPDVAVVDPERKTAGRGIALLSGLRTTASPSVEVVSPADEGKHASVQILDPRRGHRLVTFIEIVSPSNKIAGADRQAYVDKHQEVYGSEASIIEIDLLRGGQRILHDAYVANAVAEMKPWPDYVVLINRAWRRGGKPAYEIFPIPLREMLPCILVPLREGEAEVPLDLQYVFNRAYDSGPYRRGAVDYGRPPHPPLSGEDANWARQRLREANIVG